MISEIFTYQQNQEEATQGIFDLNTLFETEEDIETFAVEQEKRENDDDPSEFVQSLQSKAKEAVNTFTSNVTAETFTAGFNLTSQVFSSLNSIVGSCGVFCAHSLSSISQVGNPGILGAAGGSHLHAPEFNLEPNGNFHLNGNINSISHLTGISLEDLRSGNFSAEDILSALFGKTITTLFGFSLIGDLIDTFWDGFLPTTQAA